MTPSRLGATVLAELERVTARAALALGLREARYTPNCACTTATRACSSWLLARSEDCAPARCASGPA